MDEVAHDPVPGRPAGSVAGAWAAPVTPAHRLASQEWSLRSWRLPERGMETYMINLDINGKTVSVDLPADTPLLWTLRDELGLTGTKFGCGMALCGACTVHLDGAPTRACITPISAAVGKKVTTIEVIVATPVGKRLAAA